MGFVTVCLYLSVKPLLVAKWQGLVHSTWSQMQDECVFAMIPLKNRCFACHTASRSLLIATLASVWRCVIVFSKLSQGKEFSCKVCLIDPNSLRRVGIWNLRFKWISSGQQLGYYSRLVDKGFSPLEPDSGDYPSLLQPASVSLQEHIVSS